MIEQVLSDAENPAYVRAATARVLLRQDLLARHAELYARLEATVAEDRKYNRDPEAPALATEIEALEAEVEAAKVPFKFEAVGHRQWSDLLVKYPPSQEQLKDKPRLDFDPEKFPVAAIAASCVEPKMTLEQAKRLEKALNEAQFQELWDACIDANWGGLEAPKAPLAGVIRRMSAKSATTPVPEASLDQPSSAA